MIFQKWKDTSFQAHATLAPPIFFCSGITCRAMSNLRNHGNTALFNYRKFPMTV